MDNILPEIPRIHTAVAEWLFCMVFIIVFNNRIRGVKLMSACGISLLAISAFQIMAGQMTVQFWIIGMITAVALMFITIYLLCDLSLLDSAYNCVRAFVLAEFAASLEWQIYCYFFYSTDGEVKYILQSVNTLVVYALLFFTVYKLEIYFAPEDRRLNIRGKELLSAALIGIAAFTISNLSFAYTNTPFSARYYHEIYLVRTVIDLGGAAILYAHYILSAELRIRQELAAIENVLQRQYDQYERSKENIELINMKCHDLKNQIHAIRAEENPDKQADYLSEMESYIKLYDAHSETGHKVLDTVITSKNLVCLSNEIEFTCVVNGKLLDFMDAMDICTIFGNALDNAIECEMQISDKFKRMIHVSVFSKNSFLMIRFENYFEGNLRHFVEGVPKSTKGNKAFHGFGIKSIKYSVKKYDGSVTVSNNNNWFEMKILIPIKE